MVEKADYLIFIVLSFLVFSFGSFGDGSREGENKSQEEKQTTLNVKNQDTKNTKDISAQQVVKNLQGFYNATLDFQADFQQVYKHKIYDEEKKSSGKNN